MKEINCSYCDKLFKVRQYRLEKNIDLCCSGRCAAKLRWLKGVCHGTITETMIDSMRHDYTRTAMKCDEIAAKHGVSRSALQRLAHNYRWIKFQRIQRNRTTYRKAAQAKLGRDLQKGEHVHHINGDQTENDPGNLHVFPDARSHTACHGSLERAAFVLFKRGYIKFSEKLGRYYLA